MTLVLRFAVRSDVGLLREGNEDSAYAGPRLLAVADGMGGHAAGEVASALAIAAMAVLDAGRPPEDMVAAMAAAVATANARLQEKIAADPAVEGMGTTLTALLWADGQAAVCHIGDSRGYLLRQGELYQITHDHTLVQSLVDRGSISAEDVPTHPQRSLLLRALDGRSAAEPDLSVHDALPGDRYLLCSDGLSGVVSYETLRDTLEAVDDPDAATRELIDLANAGGGPDNITCIVADVVDIVTSRLPVPSTPLLAGAAANTASVRQGSGGSDPFGSADPDDDHLPPPAGTRIIMADDDLNPGLTRKHVAGGGREQHGPGDHPVRRSHRAQPRRARPGRRRWPIMTAALVVLVAVVAAGGYEVVKWTQRQYYLGDHAGQVVIYRGISDPIKVLWLNLSHVYDPTGIPLDQVPANDRQMVTAASVTGSLSQVQAAVKTISAAVEGCARQYSTLQTWNTKEAKYQAELAKATAGHRSTKGIHGPGQQPSVSPTCPPAQAFAPSAVSPAAAARS